MSDWLPCPYLIESEQDVANFPGLGALPDWTGCQIQEDAGSWFQLTGTYPANGANADLLKNGLYIVADAGAKEDEKKQLFQITTCSRQRDATAVINITALHVAGSLAYMTLVPDAVATQPNANAVDAFNLLKSNAADPSLLAGFTAETDIPKVANVAWHGNNLSNIGDAILGADQAGDSPTNTIQALYGAEIKANNRHLKFLQHAGRTLTIPIRYGENMVTFAEDNTTDSTYNALVPYATFTPNEVPSDGQFESVDGAGTVQYGAAGGAELYDSPYKGHSVVGHAQSGAFYKVIAKCTENTSNGNTWYEIGPNEWIDETFWTYDKTGDYIVNNTKAHGTISFGGDTDQQGYKVKMDGVGTVTYAGPGKVALWTNFVGGHTSGQYLANGGNYKVFWKGIDQTGQLWYCLGNQNTQWIPAAYFSLTKTSDYVNVATRGYLRIKGAVTVSSLPAGRGYHPAWDGTKHQALYRFTQVSQDAEGNNWYYIGMNNGSQIWVEAGDNVDLTSPGTVDYDEDKTAIANAISTGEVPVYSEPNGTNPTKKTVRQGQSFYIDQTSQSGGRTWYHIPDGWVDSSFFNFSAAADVEPGDGDDSGDDEGEVEEQTIKLDPPLLLAPGIKPYDSIRAQVQDFSSYNVRTADQLKDVAEKWMREYRFGERNYSLTITYDQMQGQYAELTAIDLYDRVPIQDDELGIAAQEQCNSVTWDVLKHIVTSCTIGSLPITYEHLLAQGQDQLTKQVGEANKHSDHLFGQINRALKLEVDDRKAAVIKIAKDLGMAKQAWTNDYEQLEDQMTTINTNVSDIHSWINSGGSGIIRAYPDWQNPTELRVLNDDGSYMRFNGHGLEYVGTDGVPRTEFDSQGRMAVENLTSGTVTGLTINGVTIDGRSYIRSCGGTYTTVMSTDYGFSVSQGNVSSALSPYQLKLYNSNGADQFLTGFDVMQLKIYMRKQGYEMSS